MKNKDYYWVDFESFRIKATSKSHAMKIVIKMLDDNCYPNICINQEFRLPLMACPVFNPVSNDEDSSSE